MFRMFVLFSVLVLCGAFFSAHKVQVPGRAFALSAGPKAIHTGTCCYTHTVLYEISSPVLALREASFAFMEHLRIPRSILTTNNNSPLSTLTIHS